MSYLYININLKYIDVKYILTKNNPMQKYSNLHCKSVRCPETQQKKDNRKDAIKSSYFIVYCPKLSGSQRFPNCPIEKEKVCPNFSAHCVAH